MTILFLSIVLALYRAAAIAWVWNVFAVELGAPAIGYATALGLQVLVVLLNSSSAHFNIMRYMEEDKRRGKSGAKERATNSAAVSTVLTTFAWLLAFIYSLFL